MGFIGMLCSTLLEMDMRTCANILVIDLVGRVNCIGVNLSLYISLEELTLSLMLLSRS